MKRKKRLLISILILTLIITSFSASANEVMKPLGELKAGDIIVDNSWEWEHKTGNGYSGSGDKKSVEWIVVAQNHYKNSTTGTVTGDHTTLVSKELIGKYAFDTTGEYGSNHWGNSNSIRPFLNNTFFNNFSKEFKDLALETNLDNKTYNGTSYSTKDKVFLPSQTELGGESTNTHTMGSDWNYFKSDSSRIAQIGGSNHYYRTRSPHAGNSNIVRYVNSDGSFSNYSNAHDAYNGVRPALNLKSKIYVKSLGGNKYEIIHNSPPELDIDTPTKDQSIKEDGEIVISGKIKDNDGDKVTISATINGKTKTLTKENTKTQQSWELKWLGTELNEGSYSNIIVTASDGKDVTKTYTGKINIDKTVPIVEFTPNGNLTASKNYSTKIKVTDPIKNSFASGLESLQYQWSETENEPTDNWINFSNEDTISIENKDGNYYLHVKAIDKVGNITIAKSNAFNLDNTPPENPTIISSETEPTNQDVVVSISYSQDSLIKEYQLNDGNWKTYTEPISLSENTTIKARATDEAGNVSDVVKIVVDNINKDLPKLTLVSAKTSKDNKDYDLENQSWTNQDIVITVSSDKGNLNKETYTFTQNGSFIFVATDEYGNESTLEVVVNKIDKSPPVINIEVKNQN